MSAVEQYRPPGRSNRSGRSQAENEVFEGLPVKQWTQAFTRISLVPPVPPVEEGIDDKWADPPMPRDYHLLTPWTQHLLRLARSGKVGTKRKQDAEMDEDKPDDDADDDAHHKSTSDDHGYIAKKWKPIPEHALEPEHKHLSFLAKRRRGLLNLYDPDQQNGLVVPMRKTKVQRADANGGIAIYEVLVPEGQSLEGEITESTELADMKPVTAAPGTVIEGVGVANEEGVVVAEHLRPRNPRRSRPPPKKKGGPGRGKKRVTFTNADGTTYTAIVPNATKIIPQPGQTIKHVAKGEQAKADTSVQEAEVAARPDEDGEQNEGGEEGSGSDDEEDEDDDDDDDDREEGELLGDGTQAREPQAQAAPKQIHDPQKLEDVQPPETVAAAPTSKEPTGEITEGQLPGKATSSEGTESQLSERPMSEATEEQLLGKLTSGEASEEQPPEKPTSEVIEEQLPEIPNEAAAEEQLPEKPPVVTEVGREEGVPSAASAAGDVEPSRDVSSSPELPLAKVPPPPSAPPMVAHVPEVFEDGDDDLLGNLEKSLGGGGGGSGGGSGDGGGDDSGDGGGGDDDNVGDGNTASKHDETS